MVYDYLRLLLRPLHVQHEGSVAQDPSPPGPVAAQLGRLRLEFALDGRVRLARSRGVLDEL